MVNLSIYYTWKITKSAHSNNKFKTTAPPWNDESDLLDRLCSISTIQVYFEYIIKKHETIADNSSMQIYINKIRVVFQIKTGYKLELLSKETMKFLGSIEKVTDRDKKRWKCSKIGNCRCSINAL